MVSIILPNLNTKIDFLNDRLITILNQRFRDWECIVIDGFSNNGSWEFLTNTVKKDGRFKLYQKPKRGIYNAWNEGIKLATGKYIYIATSDDTMHEEFLAKMVSTLEKYPSCAIAHCCLNIIDQYGALSDHRWLNSLSSQYFGHLNSQNHIRHAPHDGVLHAFVKTVYHSITQVLIRKNVFQELGLFLENAGSIADFEWGMRVSLFKDTIHVPEYLASWRIHPDQATQKDIQYNPKTYSQLIDWVSMNLTLFNRKSLGGDYNISVKQCTRVYKHNKWYFRLERFKKTSMFLYKCFRKILPNYSRYTNGITEAKQYFHKIQLDRLIEIL